MPESKKPTVLVLASMTDALAQQAAHLLRADFTPVLTSEVFGNASWPKTLRGAVKSMDAVVAVIPRAGDRGRSNVLFEVGVAVGANVPTLAVTQGVQLPSALQGLPVLPRESLNSLAERVRFLVQAEPFEPETETAVVHGTRRAAAHPPSQINEGPSQYEAFSEAQLVEILEDLFKAAGAETFVPKGSEDQPVTEVSDLLIWSDNLRPTFDLPLPVEIVRRAGTVGKIRKRLVRMMRRAGASSLVIVSASRAKPASWSDGTNFMLTVCFDDLTTQLAANPLDRALAALLEEAAHGRFEDS